LPDTNMNKWSSTSQSNLDTCSPDIIVFANAVLAVHDCTVVWGNRDEKTQNDLYDAKKSQLKYPMSRHNSFPSEAIDLVPYVPGVNPWDTDYSYYFAGLCLGIADTLYTQGKMDKRIRWGGNWSTKRDKNFKETSFYDGLHFELEA